MERLQELRDAHFEKQQKEALTIKIAKQLDDINRLKRDKEMLQLKLEALRNGCPATDLYPQSAAQDPEFVSLRNSFTSLTQKLSMYRFLGPCGLTVLDVQPESLVISLTSVCKDLTQTFVLHIADDKDMVKVAATDIPYFIDVNSMISGKPDLEWSKVMDDLGYLLSAYTQRRREAEYVQKKCQSCVKQVSYNDPITAVSVELMEIAALPSSSSHHDQTRDRGRNTNPLGLRVKLHLVCGDIRSIYPNKVSMMSSHFIPKEERAEIKSLLKSKPLSVSLPAVWDILGKINVDVSAEEVDLDV